MKKLLHIAVSPRGEKSRTLKIARAFLEEFRATHPGIEIDTLNLFEEEIPEILEPVTRGKYALMSEGELLNETREAWKGIEQQIERFLAADLYLLSTPMWNFSIPYKLKHYIDAIVQPKYLFQYTEEGVEGLAKNKRMIVISTRGGDYSENSPFHEYDQLEPYLKTVFGFVGITDITFLNAQPMDALGTEIMLEKVEASKKRGREIARGL